MKKVKIKYRVFSGPYFLAFWTEYREILNLKTLKIVYYSPFCIISSIWCPIFGSSKERKLKQQNTGDSPNRALTGKSVLKNFMISPYNLIRLAI